MNTETKRHAERQAYRRKNKYRDDPLDTVESDEDGDDETGAPLDDDGSENEGPLDEGVGDDEADDDDDEDRVRRKPGDQG